MFVFFLGMNKKKRANQPRQPARLVAETTQGLPTPRLKALWSSPGGTPLIPGPNNSNDTAEYIGWINIQLYNIYRFIYT